MFASAGPGAEEEAENVSTISSAISRESTGEDLEGDEEMSTRRWTTERTEEKTASLGTTKAERGRRISRKEARGIDALTEEGEGEGEGVTTAAELSLFASAWS